MILVNWISLWNLSLNARIMKELWYEWYYQQYFHMWIWKRLSIGYIIYFDMEGSFIMAVLICCLNFLWMMIMCTFYYIDKSKCQ